MDLKLRPHLAIWSCVLAVISPRRFLALQERITSTAGVPAASENNTVWVVRRAFWMSLLLVILSGAAGAMLGLVFGAVFGPASACAITTLQIVGASFLLWGTLFVRGWEIQTYKGRTLIERVNQWLYRALYCVGTALLVSSLTWPMV